jgi:hypothetical protein
MSVGMLAACWLVTKQCACRSPRSVGVVCLVERYGLYVMVWLESRALLDVTAADG